MQTITLKSGLWCNDRFLELSFPGESQLDLPWPSPPPALSPEEIDGITTNPIEQPPMSTAVKGKHRPVIIVDDLARPTPAFILPRIVPQLLSAGIAAENTNIVTATGTHGPQNRVALIVEDHNDSVRVY